MELQDCLRKAWVIVLAMETIGTTFAIIAYITNHLLTMTFKTDLPTPQYIQMGLWQVYGNFSYPEKVEPEWEQSTGWLWNAKIVMGTSGVIELVVIIITLNVVGKCISSRILVSLVPVLAIIGGSLGIIGVGKFVHDAEIFLDSVYVGYTDPYVYEVGWGQALYLVGNIIFFVCGLMSALLYIFEFCVLPGISDGSRVTTNV